MSRRFERFLTLITSSYEGLHEMFEKLIQESESSNMRVNSKKKLVVAGRMETQAQLSLDGDEIEKVSTLKVFDSLKQGRSDRGLGVRK